MSSSRVLRFEPMAWLKLQYFCHKGPTEVAGFAVTSVKDLLLIQDFITIKQTCTSGSFEFDDDAVQVYVNSQYDKALSDNQFFRICCHTHPGSCPRPSSKDEEVFDRVFRDMEWAVMFIMSRTSETYARLTIRGGPGLEQEIPVAVDMTSWTAWLDANAGRIAELRAAWDEEFVRNVHSLYLQQVWTSGKLDTFAPYMEANKKPLTLDTYRRSYEKRSANAWRDHEFDNQEFGRTDYDLVYGDYSKKNTLRNTSTSFLTHKEQEDIAFMYNVDSLDDLTERELDQGIAMLERDDLLNVDDNIIHLEDLADDDSIS